MTLNLPELVPVRHGHPRPPEGPRPRRGAAESQIRRQSTGTRSGDLRPSEAYALPIQGYHMDLSTGAGAEQEGFGAQPLSNSGSFPFTYTHNTAGREPPPPTQNFICSGLTPLLRFCSRLSHGR